MFDMKHVLVANPCTYSVISLTCNHSHTHTLTRTHCCGYTHCWSEVLLTADSLVGLLCEDTQHNKTHERSHTTHTHIRDHTQHTHTHMRDHTCSHTLTPP